MDETLKKPIIGVSTSDSGGIIPWFFIWLMLWMTGGRAVRITPKRKRSLEGLRGLVLSGGADIAPTLYGEEKLIQKQVREAARRGWWTALIRLAVSILIYITRLVFGLKASPSVDPERDKLEGSLLREAIARRIPVLGICRGMQFVNIYFGGSLYQHLDEFYGEAAHPHTVLPYKAVTFVEGSRLREILDVNVLKVNALHNQAVKDLGDGIAVSGKDARGVIQALEHGDFPFVIGVQWHPEFMPQFAPQRKLFRALIRNAQQFQPQ